MNAEEIKQKKLMEMQQQMQGQMQDQLQEQAQMQQQVAQLESVVKSQLSKEALARYGNIKAADPEKALQIIVLFAQLMQSGKIQGTIDDILFKRVLEKLTPQTKKTVIRRV